MENIIEEFLKVSSGSGYGSGYGDGSGDCYGDGDGYGDGSGYGYGDGDGYGDGSGDGYGYGYGYGYGDGSGDGYGYGYGYGSCYGILCFNGKKVHMIDGIQTIIHSVHNNIAKCDAFCVDLTLEPCYVAKVGNFFSHGDTAREAYSNAKMKYDDNIPIDDKIRMFIEKHPKLDTYVTASELFKEHNFLTGSCEFGRRVFCKKNNIDIEKDKFTISQFIDLTINEYGGDIIRKLKETYKNKIYGKY